MSNNALQKKVQMNYEIAEYAEKKQYFDVAISRYYYALYQKMLIYLAQFDRNDFNKWYKKRYKKKKEENEIINHWEKIAFFIDIFRSNNPSVDRIKIANIQKLRKKRNEADYDDFIFDGDKFIEEFKNDFVNVWSLIKI